MRKHGKSWNNGAQSVPVLSAENDADISFVIAMLEKQLAMSNTNTTELLNAGSTKSLRRFLSGSKRHTKRPLRNMDRTCKTAKGQVNAINYFLTVMAEQESSTYPHSPSLGNGMGLNHSFMWASAAVGPPMTFRKGQKIRPFEKRKITFYARVLFTLQLKHKML